MTTTAESDASTGAKIAIIPQPDDILLGRNKMNWKHEGNKRFRNLISEYHLEYKTSPRREDKSAIVTKILEDIQRHQGRFLQLEKKKQGTTNRGSNKNWVLVTKSRTMRTKISNALRDKYPAPCNARRLTAMKTKQAKTKKKEEEEKKKEREEDQDEEYDDEEYDDEEEEDSMLLLSPPEKTQDTTASQDWEANPPPPHQDEICIDYKSFPRTSRTFAVASSPPVLELDQFSGVVQASRMADLACGRRHAAALTWRSHPDFGLTRAGLYASQERGRPFSSFFRQDSFIEGLSEQAQPAKDVFVKPHRQAPWNANDERVFIHNNIGNEINRIGNHVIPL